MFDSRCQFKPFVHNVSGLLDPLHCEHHAATSGEFSALPGCFPCELMSEVNRSIGFAALEGSFVEVTG